VRRPYGFILHRRHSFRRSSGIETRRSDSLKRSGTWARSRDALRTLSNWNGKHRRSINLHATVMVVTRRFGCGLDARDDCRVRTRGPGSPVYCSEPKMVAAIRPVERPDPQGDIQAASVAPQNQPAVVVIDKGWPRLNARQPTARRSYPPIKALVRSVRHRSACVKQAEQSRMPAHPSGTASSSAASRGRALRTPRNRIPEGPASQVWPPLLGGPDPYR